MDDRAPDRRPAPDRVPALAALATALVGAINIASALTPALPDRLQLLLTLAPVQELSLAQGLALPAGIALLVAAWFLWRRRARAATGAILLLAGAGAIDVLKGLDIEEALISWALAAALWRWRGAFTVVHHHALRAREALRIAATAILAVGPLTLLLDHAGHLSRIGPLGLAPVLGAAVLSPFLAARPLRGRVDDRDRAAELVRRHGSDTLSAFKLRSDLQRRWTDADDALAAFTVQFGTMCLAGDPVGTADAQRRLLEELRGESRRHGLSLCAVGASEDFAAVAAECGMRSLYLGDEAIVSTGPMDLEGRRRKALRKAINRVRRHGFTAELVRADDLSDGTLTELEAVSSRWLGASPERGFSMAHDRLRDELLPDALLIVARDGEGAVRGFLHFVPVFGRPVVSLGFMRADRDGPNGLTEFMVHEAARLLEGAGIESFSLNFISFGRWLREPSGLLERHLAGVLRAADRWFQIQRLLHFNERFSPTWNPRFLLFGGHAELPRVALAAMRAEGQLPTLAVARRRDPIG
ncbi:MAG: lysyl-tRNA synthetase, class [Solirubrobacteraceae bacterium]|nr:lysyl-tRNA synthetase, class [Solirubrobacteraceae bacterium]